MTSTSRSALAFLLAGSLLLVACSTGSGQVAQPGTTIGGPFAVDVQMTAPGEPQDGGSIVIGVEAESSGWNPNVDRWGAAGTTVASSFFDSLARYDVDDVPQPFLAERFTPNEDFTEWTIDLRADVQFHNGQPVDAAAVVANLEAQRTSILLGNVFKPIVSIEATDPRTVVVTMNTPWSTYPQMLTGQAGSIAAPEQLTSETPSLHPIGSGPFTFVDWAPDSSLRVARNPDYWQPGLPHLDEIRFQTLVDEMGRSQSLASGSTDIIQVSDPVQLVALSREAAAGQIQMYTGNGQDTPEAFLGLNVAAPPFNDRLARRLLAAAIDTQSLSQLVYNGVFAPAKGPFIEGSPLYVGTDYPSYDATEASRLATKYAQRYGEPLRFTLKIGTEAELLAIAQAIQQQLEDVGVEMSIEGVEQTTLLVDGLVGNYQATYFSLFGAPTLDREYAILVDSTVAPIGQVSLNFTRNANPVLTGALDAVRRTDDPAEQKAQYQVIQEQLAADLALVFLVHTSSAVAYNNSVQGLADPVLPGGQPARRTLVNSLAQIWRST